MDSSLPDGSQPDVSIVQDASTPDTLQIDVLSADANSGPDLVVHDAARPDTTRPDIVPTDTLENYGPYVATGVPAVVPDATAGADGSIYIPINVPQQLTVFYVDVHFEVSHDDAHEIKISLIPPMGTAEVLFEGSTECSTGQCPASIVRDMRKQVYQSTQGTWALHVVDTQQTQTGMVHEFALSFVP